MAGSLVSRALLSAQGVKCGETSAVDSPDGSEAEDVRELLGPFWRVWRSFRVADGGVSASNLAVDSTFRGYRYGHNLRCLVRSPSRS